MAKNKKKHSPNPNNIPCSKADVERAKTEATTQAMDFMLTLVLYCLKDYFGWSDGRVMRMSRRVNKVATMISEGYITLHDIKSILGEEYDYTIEIK